MSSVDIGKHVFILCRSVAKSHQKNNRPRVKAEDHQASQERENSNTLNVRVQLLALVAMIAVPMASWSQDISTSSSEPESALKANSVNSRSSAPEELFELPLDISPLLPQHSHSPVEDSDPTSKVVTSADLPKTLAAWRAAIVANPKMLNKLAFASPYEKNGKLLGYQFEPKQNSESQRLFEMLGIHVHDVITRVNDIELNSSKHGVSALKTAVRAESLDLTVLRDDVEVLMTISFNEDDRQVDKIDPVGNLPTTPGALRDALVRHSEMIVRIIHAVPYEEEGKLRGYRFSPSKHRKSRKVFEALGMFSGDVVTRVNNIELNSQANVIAAVVNAVHAQGLELMVLRSGVEVPVSILFNEDSRLSSKNNPTTDSPKRAAAMDSKFVGNQKKSVRYFSVAPYEEDGKLRGYRVTLEQNSEYLKKYDFLAIREGDVITSVNDIELNNRKTAIATLKDALKAQLVKFTVLRDGAKVHVLMSLAN